MDRKAVLTIDDNPEIRELLYDILSEDYGVIQAVDGEEAIELLTMYEETVDLVILDVEMPRTDGFETLRIIRDLDNGWPNMPVIMLTVCKEPESALKAWGIGANFYMTKPFSPTELLGLVGKVLTEKQHAV